MANGRGCSTWKLSEQETLVELWADEMPYIQAYPHDYITLTVK